MQVYDSDDGGWVVVGGTSEASPLIAAYYAVVGSASQGPAWAYSNADLLNDVTSGSNGTCAATISYICNAGPGYDGPTGVGSISGAVSAGAPGIAGPGANGSYAQTVTAGTAQLQGGVYPNGTDTTYWWEYGTTSAYGQTTTPNDIGPGTDPVPVSDSLTGLSPGATYHYRLVAENSFGTEYGYDYTFTTPASTLSSPGQGTTQNPPTTTTTTTTTITTTPTGPTTGSGGSGTSGTAPAPMVTAVRIGAAATTATVTATIATGGAATSYSLQYGTTQTLGKSLSGSQSSGAAATARWTLRNLSPGKIYFLRVVASNAGGSGAGSLIRFRTSPVTITKINRSGGFLNVTLRCHGSAACHITLQGRSGTRVLLSSQATIRGNHGSTVTLRLSKAFQTAVTRHQNATLLALTTWNGSTATVSATV
jgi:Fibronectin type III domain